jgi:transcriptional regulator with XRE-family HTH domain
MPEHFGALLKTWRGQRRLSQLDLGLAANVSARHISFLETGRARPSKSMVLALAETLEVPRASRNVLLQSAGFARAYVQRDLAADEMAYVRQAIDWMLERHDPYPGIALDKHWNLLQANACAANLMSPMGLAAGDSLLDAVLDGPFAEALENREEILRHMLARLRTEISHLGGDAVLEAAVDKFAAQLPPELPPSAIPMPAVLAARYRVHGMTLAFFSTISAFGSTEDIALADVRIELMFPADAQTRALLTGRA